jgi:hypothetical protein
MFSLHEVVTHPTITFSSCEFSNLFCIIFTMEAIFVKTHVYACVNTCVSFISETCQTGLEFYRGNRGNCPRGRTKCRGSLRQRRQFFAV